TGTGSFALDAGGTLATASTAGIAASSATGSIQTSTRIFDTAGLYTFNGATAQITGDGLPSAVDTLTLSDAVGVTLTASTQTNNVLQVTSGTVPVGVTLTPAGA